MKSISYDEQQFTEWLFRFGGPILAWGLMFLFFAFAGSVSEHEPTRTADASLAAPLIDDDVSIAASGMTRSLEPEPRDAVVDAHEALDPVGAGRNPAP